MRIGPALPLSALLGLAACGGSDPPASGPPQNAFTGTIQVSGPMPAGTTTCLTSAQVVFSDLTVDTHTVTVGGGGCVTFLNGGTTAHRVASNVAASCSELNSAAGIAAGNSYSTVPLDGPRTCYWKDTAHEPAAPGGGGGGGGGGY
jgi:hypothetical protein